MTINIKSVTRRDLIRKSAGTALLYAAGMEASAQMAPAQSTPQTPAEALTVEDLAIADKVAGRTYTEPQR